jgi:heptosyltransferase-2
MSFKIIIRTPNHLGDCVLALPMINETREAYPGSSLAILAPEKLSELYENNQAVDKIIKFPGQYAHGLAGVFKLREFIKDEEFDLGFVLPPSFSSASVFKLSGVKERVGYVTDGRRLLLTKPLSLPAPINSEHRGELYFNLLKRASGMKIEFTKPKIFLSDADIANGQKVLKDFGIEGGEKFVAIAFRAVGESRRWGKEKYTELTKRLISEFNLKVVLIGKEEDRTEGDEIARGAGATNVLNLSGKTGVRELASVLSLSHSFIGNDSGAAHLAAAVGVPIVVLSGADDPKETSPIANRKKLIYLSHLNCISCVKNKCELKGEAFMQCMKGIGVDMVLGKFRELHLVN